MSKFIKWDEAPANSNGGGQFLKLKAGNTYIVRLVGSPLRYLQHWEPIICRSPGLDPETNQPIDPLMQMGYVPKSRYAMWVLDRNDNSALKIMDFPQQLLECFRDWKDTFTKEPGGAEGPDFRIKVESGAGGDPRKTKYKATAMESKPFTEEEKCNIKKKDLKKVLNELRRDNTPEEIRKMLEEKNITGHTSGQSSTSDHSPKQQSSQSSSAPQQQQGTSPPRKSTGETLDLEF